MRIAIIDVYPEFARLVNVERRCSVRQAAARLSKASGCAVIQAVRRSSDWFGGGKDRFSFDAYGSTVAPTRASAANTVTAA